MALSHHQAGRMQDAEALYRAVLLVQPNHPDANHNLGILAVQTQRLNEALPLFNTALKANPASVQYWLSYIDALIEAGERQVAAQMLALGRAHGLDGAKVNALEARLEQLAQRVSFGTAPGPDDNADAGQKDKGLKKKSRETVSRTGNRAPGREEIDTLVSLFNQGRFPETEALARSLTERFPDFADGWKLLAVALRQQMKAAEALVPAQKAVSLLPRDAESHANLGNVLKDLGDFQAADASYLRALSIKPDYAEAHANLGSLLRAQNRLAEAEVSLRRAVKFKPGLAAAQSNLGNVLFDLGKLDDALACFTRAVELRPDFAEAHYHIGNTLVAMREAAPPGVQTDADSRQVALERALACFQRALQIRPNFPDVQYALALLYLLMGDLDKGWKGYESRWAKTLNPPLWRNFRAPLWDGSDLTGKRILIWGEQGIGDELLWAGMFQEVIDRAGQCVIECTPKLLPLLVRSFPRAKVVARADVPHPATREEFDYQCPAGSLARWLRPTLESFPAENRYLVADPARVAYWKSRLALLGPGPKIGFGWRSGKSGGGRDLNYTTLEEWGPIFTVPDVHFVNLQYGDCADELDEARRRFGVPLHVFEEVDLFNNLDEAAALTAAMDLVIPGATATLSVSAALGVPTLLMLFSTVGWATLGTDHMPWCPEMRCFTRKWNEPWDEAIRQVAHEVAMLADKSRKA